MKIKTIDITTLEWFDKVNGNSYFAAEVTLNYQLNDDPELEERTIKLPFQYGYGDHSKHQAFAALEEQGLITDREHYKNGSAEAPGSYCERKGIILRYTKHENCKKRELKEMAA